MTQRSPELVFGLVGAIGTDLNAVSDSLKDQLERVGYSAFGVKLSSLLSELEGSPWNEIPPRSSSEFYDKAMSAGDELCRRLGRSDAVVALGIDAMRVLRKSMPPQKSRGTAFIFNSLKRPSMAHPYEGRAGYGSGLSRVRSASPARQVGAAITDSAGRVLSIGTNEVPRFGGGQYWEEDTNDGRDYRYEKHDLSDRMRRNLLHDLIFRLRESKMLADSADVRSVLEGKTDPSGIPSLRSAQLFDTIDYVRSVHAEAAAILTAPSRTDLAGSVLYATTFPCHECARHIVMAGIKRVVYVEPYPKSLVSELYRDSIVVDPKEDCESGVSFVPFVGIAPTLYTALFEASSKRRKAADGSIAKWIPLEAFPHNFPAYSEHASKIAETEMLEIFNSGLREIGAVSKKSTNKVSGDGDGKGS